MIPVPLFYLKFPDGIPPLAGQELQIGGTGGAEL
jgi:hypothetical protein